MQSRLPLAWLAALVLLLLTTACASGRGPSGSLTLSSETVEAPPYEATPPPPPPPPPPVRPPAEVADNGPPLDGPRDVDLDDFVIGEAPPPEYSRGTRRRPPATAELEAAAATAPLAGIAETDPNALLQTAIRRFVDSLAEGKIAYNPPAQMRQGESETVVVRITDRPDEELGAGFPAGSSVIEERIKVAPRLTAVLEGDEKDFEIAPRSAATQVVGGAPVEWRWDVTPLRAGDRRRLHLRVTADVPLPGGSEKRELLLKAADIRVQVNPGYVIGGFVSRNWQYLLGTLVLPPLGWFLKRKLAPAPKD